MKLLRRLSLLLVTSLLRVVTFGIVSLTAILLVVGHQGHIENTLIKTDTYRQFVPSIVQSLGETSHNDGGIPFDDPGVQKIINNALPPQTVQASANTVINSTYGWLNGSKNTLNFRIDLTKNRQLLTDDLSAYAFNRLTKQPLCVTQPQTIDPFTANCLPRSYDIHEEQAAFASEIDALFPKTVFTANDLPRFSNGKSLAHDYPNAPRIYRLILDGPWLLIGLFLLLSCLLILLCRNLRHGARLLGSIMLSSGIALAITPLLYILVYPHINHSLSLQSANTGVNVLMNKIFDSLGSDFNNNILKGALLTINIGLAILIAERLTRAAHYQQLSTKSGLASSEGIHSIQEGGSLTADMVPLQSSEISSKRSSKKHYGISKRSRNGDA